MSASGMRWSPITRGVLFWQNFEEALFLFVDEKEEALMENPYLFRSGAWISSNGFRRG